MTFNYFKAHCVDIIISLLPVPQTIARTCRAFHFFFKVSVWFQLKPTFTFSFPRFCLFFLFQRMNSKFTVQRQKLLFMHCSSTVHILQQHCSRIKNIKNGSHGTFHTFKNYFATVFSVFSFSNNKLNPNGPLSSGQQTWIRKGGSKRILAGAFDYISQYYVDQLYPCNLQGFKFYCE